MELSRKFRICNTYERESRNEIGKMTCGLISTKTCKWQVRHVSVIFLFYIHKSSYTILRNLVPYEFKI